MNDNICSRYMLFTDDNGFKRVIYVTKGGVTRKDQRLFLTRVEAVAAAEPLVGRPIPKGAQPA